MFLSHFTSCLYGLSRANVSDTFYPSWSRMMIHLLQHGTHILSRRGWWDPFHIPAYYFSPKPFNCIIWGREFFCCWMKVWWAPWLLCSFLGIPVATHKIRCEACSQNAWFFMMLITMGWISIFFATCRIGFRQDCLLPANRGSQLFSFPSTVSQSCPHWEYREGAVKGVILQKVFLVWSSSKKMCVL